jgi:hypothetical protein
MYSMCIRFNIPLSSHVWVSTKLLNDKTAAIEMPSYYCYVTSTCIRKICRRFNHSLSKPYINSLILLDNVIFKLTPKLTKTREEEDEGRELDRTALNWITNALTPEDQVKFPEFMKKIEAKDDMDFKLYCAKTCQEYHKILCHLLLSFNDCLLAVNGFTDSKPGDTIKDQVQSAALYALALQAMIASPAFLQHLQNVQVPLHRLFLSEATTKTEGTTETEGPEIVDQDYDDLMAVQPNALRDDRMLALPEAYDKWLRLMLTHYDAAKILYRYVKGERFEGNVVKMDILDTPLADNAMLSSWSDLFSSRSSSGSDSKEPTSYIPDSADEPTNDEIYTFLEKAVKINFYKNKGIIVNIRNSFRRLVRTKFKDIKDFDSLSKGVGTSKVDLEAWNVASPDIIRYLTEIKARSANDEEISDLCQDIERIFKAVLGSLSFFEYLKNMTFNGRDHCEVSLACLLAASRTNCINLDPSINAIFQDLEVGCETS